jgi:hypothetical protein
MNRGGLLLNATGNDEKSNARFDDEFGVEKHHPAPWETRSDQYCKVLRSSNESDLKTALERTREGISSTDFGELDANLPTYLMMITARSILLHQTKVSKWVLDLFANSILQMQSIVHIAEQPNF